MTRERHFGTTSIARAKASVKKARAVRTAISQIHRLCSQALAAKTDADFQSTVAALSVAAGFVTALTR
jgi:hypothetical protein